MLGFGDKGPRLAACMQPAALQLTIYLQIPTSTNLQMLMLVSALAVYVPVRNFFVCCFADVHNLNHKV